MQNEEKNNSINEVPKETWEIEFINKEGEERSFKFRRYINGKLNENYRHCSDVEAIMWFSEIINGLEPGRNYFKADNGVPRESRLTEVPPVNTNRIGTIDWDLVGEVLEILKRSPSLRKL